MNQNPNQEVEYISGFLEEEVVEDSDFDEHVEDQEKADDLAENKQNEQQEKEQSKKPKRPRKTIEQEIAELDAKRERLMEKKRKQEAHEKIVFGSTVIAMLKEMKGRKDRNGPVICKTILEFIEVEQPKNLEIIDKILKELI